MFEETTPRGRYVLVLDQLQNVITIAILSYLPDSMEGCRDQFIAVLIVLSSYCGALLVVRPYLSNIANVIVIAIAFLQALAAWSLFIAFQLDSHEWIMVYTALNFATLGLQAVAAVHSLGKTAWEALRKKDGLSRGITFWSVLDREGSPYLDVFQNGGLLCHWPLLDPIIERALERSFLAAQGTSGGKKLLDFHSITMMKESNTIPPTPTEWATYQLCSEPIRCPSLPAEVSTRADEALNSLLEHIDDLHAERKYREQLL
jgi:hypothetical protein